MAGSGPRFYCISARTFAAAGNDPGHDRGRLPVGNMGDGGSWWAFWTRLAWEMVALDAVSSPPTLSESSESHVRSIWPHATGSGLALQAGRTVAGRSPSYPSRIRVERTESLGTAGPGARCPAAAGAVPGLICAAGRSEHHQRADGGIKFR